MIHCAQERESYKYKLWRVVESTPFEYFIMTLIVLNTILLMLKVILSRSRYIYNEVQTDTNATVNMCSMFSCSKVSLLSPTVLFVRS